MERITSAICTLHGCRGLAVEPYGSFVSGFCLPSSDLDMALVGCFSTGSLPPHAFQALQAKLGEDKVRSKRQQARCALLTNRVAPELLAWLRFQVTHLLSTVVQHGGWLSSMLLFLSYVNVA